MPGDRPLIGSHHRDPAPKNLPHVRDAGLAALRRTRRHLDEHVRVCRSKTFDRTPPMTNAGQLTERPPAGHVLEQDPWVEAIGVVDEAVTRIGDAHDRRNESVSPFQPRGVLVKGTKQPLPDGPQSHDPHAHVLHRTTGPTVLVPKLLRRRSRSFETAGRPPKPPPTTTWCSGARRAHCVHSLEAPRGTSPCGAAPSRATSRGRLMSGPV
jgi:hypothetical protein